jgi:hypothetical protein
MAEDAGFSKWLNELKGTVEDESVKTSIDNLLQNEKAKNFIKSGYMAHQDYTQKTQELARNRQAMEDRVAKLQQWFETESPKNTMLASQLAAREQELAALQEKIELLGSEESKGDSSMSDNNFDPEKFVRREDYDQLASTVKAFDQNALAFNLDLAEVQNRMRKEGFDLPIKNVYAYSAQNKVDLVTAYEDLTAKDRQSQYEQFLAAKLQEARDEGYKSALSKHNLPDSAGNDAPLVTQIAEGLNDPAKRKAAALRAFMDAKTG